MANLINILIDATWRGKGELKKTSGDLRQLGNNATKTSAEMKKASLGFGSMQTKLIAASIAAGVLTVAFKKLYGVIESGADLQLVEQRFDRLALSIGTTGEALREDLGGAIRGLTSDAKAMALATDFMALGLVKSHDEAIRLASVAAQLGFDMNQLVLTLTNMTTMRFDALGVSVDGFKEKVKDLEDAGHDANEAFKLAFLEQAEDQIEKVGSRIEETAGKLDVIGAAWSNTMDDIKGGTTSTFEPIIALFADVIIAAGDAETAVGKFGEALGDLETQEAAIEAVTAALQELNFLSIFTPGSVLKTREALIDLAVQLSMTGETLEEQKAILESFGFTILDQEFRLHAMKVSWTEFQAALDIALFERLAEQAGVADTAFRNLDGAFVETAREWSKLTDETDKWTDAVQAAIDKANELSLSMIDLGTIQTADQLAGVVGRQVQTMLDDARGTRLDIWLDFQTDLTDISEREGERRAEVEGRHEERRTDIVDQSGERRAKLEEQSALRLDRIREDSADRQVQIRDAGNQRLSDLERDHLDRMQEIIENADLQLMDAASRLDARAVARIKRQREDALGDETDAFKKQRKDIKRQLDERIKAEQKAEEKRIRREEENNALRLQQMEDAHREQLEELKDKHDDELQEIKDNAIKARIERENNYIDERMQLDAQWRAKDTLDTKWMNAILIKEEQFWKSRLNLVGGGGGGTIDPTEDPTGGDERGDGERPNRMWLEQTAVRVAADKGGDIFAWSQYFKKLGDAQLAAWIEANSGIDVPGYALGGRVPRDMLIKVGEHGEELLRVPGGTEVFDSSLTRQFFSKAGVNIGELNVIVNESERPSETGEEVEEKLLEVFKELANE